MKLILPLSITLPRKTKADKVFAINLNIYRNSHHQILNQAKIQYRDLVQSIWHEASPYVVMPLNPPYRFVYTVFPSSGRKFDLGNVCSIIDKFTADSLVEMGVIPDDNYKIIKAVDYRFGYIDKDTPRVELEIFSWTDKEIL